MFPVRQPGLTRPALHEDRLGQRRAGLFAVHRHRVFGAITRNALEVYAVPPPGLQQETMTSPRYGAYEEETRPVGAAWAPAATLAVPCPMRSGGSGHAPAETPATRPSPQRQRCPRRPSAIVSGSGETPTCRPPTPRAGRSWPPRGAQRAVQRRSCFRPTKSNTPAWHPACAGSRPRRRSAPGWLEQPARMAVLAMLTVVG
jgi:hypothetical protein